MAARFGNWQLVRPDDVLGSDVATVTIQDVTVIDSFRLDHEPELDLWLDCGKAWWLWRRVIKREGATWMTPGGRPEIRVK